MGIRQGRPLQILCIYRPLQILDGSSWRQKPGRFNMTNRKGIFWEYDVQSQIVTGSRRPAGRHWTKWLYDYTVYDGQVGRRAEGGTFR